MKLTIRQLNSALAACEREKVAGGQCLVNPLKNLVDECLRRGVQEVEVPETELAKNIIEIARLNERYQKTFRR